MSDVKRSNRATPVSDRTENPFQLNVDVRNDGSLVVYDRLKKETVYEETAERSKDDPDYYPLKNPLKVLVFDQLFFLKGYDKPSQIWFESTPYRFKGDEISVYERGERTPVLKKVKRDSQEVANFEVNLSACPYVFGCLNDGRMVRFQFTASGRNVLMKFNQENRNDTGVLADFVLVGFRQSYEAKTGSGKTFYTFDTETDGKRNKPVSLVPVLEIYNPSDIEMETADELFAKSVEYLKTPLKTNGGKVEVNFEQGATSGESSDGPPADDLPF